MIKKKISKRYQSLIKNFDKNKALKIDEAVKIIKEKSKAKFIESFDVSFSLAVDKSKPDSVLRTTVDLPNGNGKKIRIAVICPNDKIEEAKAAGTFVETRPSKKRRTDAVESTRQVSMVTTTGTADFTPKVDLPKTTKQALAMDKAEGNTKWKDAMDKASPGAQFGRSSHASARRVEFRDTKVSGVSTVRRSGANHSD